MTNAILCEECLKHENEERMSRQLKSYMSYAGYPDEGAILVFAYEGKDAKKLAWPEISSWSSDINYTDLRVNRLRGEHLMKYADMEMMAKGMPHIVDAPPSCKSCLMWGNVIGNCGLCSECCGVKAEDICMEISFNDRFKWE